MRSSIVLGLALMALMATSVLANGSFAYDIEFAAGLNVSVDGIPLTELQLGHGGLQFRFAPLIGGRWAALNNGYVAATTGLNLTILGLPHLEVDYEVDIAALGAGGPYHLNSHFNASVLSILPGLNFDAAASANLIASFPYAIVEVDSNGADVAVHYIKDLTWSLLNTVKTTSVRLGVLAYAAAGVNTDGSSFNVTVTLQTSVVAGVSNYLGCDLLPKAWAHTLNVTNYVLSDASHSIRIVQGVATGEANIDLSASGAITCPYGNNSLLQAYAELNASVVVGQNTTAQADVSAFVKAATTSIIDSFPDLKAQLNGRFGANFGVYFANITHPSGHGNCTHSGRTATGNRLAESAAAVPGASPDTPFTPDTPISPAVPPTLAPFIPSVAPSAASSVPVSFAVVIAVLALLGMFF